MATVKGRIPVLCHTRIRRFTWYAVHPVSLPLSGFSAAVPPLGMQAARTKNNHKAKKLSIIMIKKRIQTFVYNMNLYFTGVFIS